jgi:hypothetical protein
MSNQLQTEPARFTRARLAQYARLCKPLATNSGLTKEWVLVLTSFGISWRFPGGIRCPSGKAALADEAGRATPLWFFNSDYFKHIQLWRYLLNIIGMFTGSCLECSPTFRFRMS